MKLTVLQKLRSHIYPVLLRRASSPYNPVLELYYYRGRWQLATADALYSDGIYYRPLVAAFKAIRAFLPQVNNLLVLGTGLGSAVQILDKKGFHPHSTLVELDGAVLDLALELMPPQMAANVTPVCADAQTFIQSDNGCYDLLVVDIFNGRQVPEFVLGAEFLNHCKARISSHGKLVLNYMIVEPNSAQKAKAALAAAFGKVHELDLGINRVYIATA